MIPSDTIARKTIHTSGLLLPFLALYSPESVYGILFGFTVLYLFAEWQKLKGQPFPVLRSILFIQRSSEKNRIAWAPVLLAAGVGLSLAFFSWEAAFLGIYQVTVCDTAAHFGGRIFGGKPLPYSKKKTWAGLICFFIAALPVCLYFFPAPQAIFLALAGSLVESFPAEDWDNITIPLVVANLAQWML